MSTGFGPDPQNPGYSAAAYQPGGGTGKNPAGRLALAAGIVVVVVSLVQQVGAYLLPYLMDQFQLSSAQAFGRYNLIVSLVTALFALIALIAGGMGLSGSGKPKGAAGAGFALGAMAILSVLVGLIAPSVVDAII